MTTPEVPSQDAQEVVTELLSLPDEILKYITEYVPSLANLAVTNERLSGIATEVNQERVDEWVSYASRLHNDLDLANLPNVDANAAIDGNTANAICAWILSADEYTNQMDNLPPSAQALAQDVPGFITQGLQGDVGTFVQVAAQTGYPLDDAVTGAFDRIMRRWVD